MESVAQIGQKEMRRSPLKAKGYLDIGHFSEIHQPNKATWNT
jgi:hypothetical protein